MAVATVPEYGGYDNDFVIEVPEKFICTICTKVLRVPRLTECCGQLFCESCLTHWLRKNQAKTCPHCREKNFVHIQDKPRKREINQLKVHCRLHKDGCTWQGELGDLQAHLDSDTGCGFVEVECPNKCTVHVRMRKVKALKRKDIAQHLSSECFLRRYKCEHCTFEDTYMAITGDGAPSRRSLTLSSSNPYPCGSHYSECPMIPLDCPNVCGAEKIKQKDMRSHRDQCPLEKLECPNHCRNQECMVHSDQFVGSFVSFWGFRGAECVCKRINRKDLEQHLRTQCYLRKYTCEHCGHKDTYQAITGKGGPKPVKISHYQTCPDFPLVCPNKCRAVDIKRKDMPTHREQCPLEPVQCPFQEAGCQTRLVRRDLDNHMATQTQQHLLLIFQTVKKQGDDLEKLRKENNDLKQELQKRRR